MEKQVRKHTINLGPNTHEALISEAIQMLPRGYLKALIVRLLVDRIGQLGNSADELKEKMELIVNGLHEQNKHTLEPKQEVSEAPKLEDMPATQETTHDPLSTAF